MLKKILVGLLIILVILQFFRPKKNHAAGPFPNDITNVYTTQPDVQSTLNTACYDCHSNNTTYPWYAEIQPVRWWLEDHIEEGKRELNFHEFKTYSLRKQYHKLEEIAEVIEKQEMPLESYTLIHNDAKLNENQKNSLIAWVNGTKESMKAKYPIDSLIKK